ncbi:MAG: M28 family peptidase [Acidobacteriota bacterium]|nr:M28 family peptidase [Acidobacteriota bacterium]
MNVHQKREAGFRASFRTLPVTLGAVLLCAAALACGGSHAGDSSQAAKAAAPPAAAPPASQTGGFDGARAWTYLEKIVSFGPRPPASANIHLEQAWLVSQLQSFGCQVSEDNFQAQTGVGKLAMENIVAKIPGKDPGIVLLLSHYDTLRLPGFVGADDGGSSTAVLLEVAHDMCGKPSPLTVWIAFLDGEEEQTNFQSEQEAQTIWTSDNNTFGSRELAASMELSGDLEKVKALLLADMVGDANLGITRESNSTPWLEQLVWSVAKRLGYTQYFLSTYMSVTDDHTPFLSRHVPSADIIDFNYPYWHTSQDTLDKCSPHSLAVVGHVFLESIQALDQKFVPQTHGKS